jgi:hypothetical protein
MRATQAWWLRHAAAARAGGALLALACLCGSRPAHALDKQGSAHGGDVAGSERGFGLSGSLLAGAALYNPTYAARPDNSGLMLGRIAPHFDVDLIGSRLSVPIDLNVFTDRQRAGLGKIAPSELDVIGGLTTTWPIGPSALEVGARFERDMPVDKRSLTQSYADLRVRWLGSLAAIDPDVPAALDGGDLTGHLALGVFGYNPSYASRPDNSGLALFRYQTHVELSAWNGHLLLGVDATMFTDRRENALRPSELDLIFDLGTRIKVVDLHLAYERDMPVDRAGLVQQLLLLYATWGFEIVDNPTIPRPLPGSEPEHPSR